MAPNFPRDKGHNWMRSGLKAAVLGGRVVLVSSKLLGMGRPDDVQDCNQKFLIWTMRTWRDARMTRNRLPHNRSSGTGLRPWRILGSPWEAVEHCPLLTVLSLYPRDCEIVIFSTLCHLRFPTVKLMMI